jgi:hypothetical protein
MHGLKIVLAQTVNGIIFGQPSLQPGCLVIRSCPQARGSLPGGFP